MLIGSGVVALVVLGGFWLSLWLVAGARGIDVPSTDVAHIVGTSCRAVLLCMGAALGGFALTMIFRHTVATLALLFVYSVAGEIVVGLLPWDGVGPLLGGQQRLRLAGHRTSTYFDPSIDCSPGTSCTGIQTMSHLESGLFLGVLAARRGGGLARLVPPRRRVTLETDSTFLGGRARTVERVTQAPEQVHAGARGTQAAAARGAQRRDARSSASRRGSRPARRWARSTPSSRAW